MKKIIFNLGLAIFVWLGSCCIATAQAPVAQSDQITQDQQTLQSDDTKDGKFEPVTVDGLTTSDVGLQFSTTLANTQVLVEALDGGALAMTSESTTIDANGQLSFQFETGNEPGVYRVVVINPNGSDEGTAAIAALVEFDVPAVSN